MKGVRCVVVLCCVVLRDIVRYVCRCFVVLVVERSNSSAMRVASFCRVSAPVPTTLALLFLVGLCMWVRWRVCCVAMDVLLVAVCAVFAFDA